jgi:DNA-directed RNA polymerase specialized sigma subunit
MIMEIEKGKTYKYLREKREVSQVAKDNLKQFIKIKKSILDALQESDLTIEQLTQKLNMPANEVVYYLMSLVKYGFVQTGAVDDMDAYFSYKLKK